jgi:hypothetical protein
MPIRNASVRLVQRGPDKPYRTSLQWQARRRAADLTRIYRDQFPNGLPHNSLGVKCARYLCRTMAFDPIDCRAQWLDRYASWIDADTRSKILSLGPHWYSASSLGQHLELYDEDRERLQAWTIEACNVTKDERKVINKGKNRKAQERHRRKNGSVLILPHQDAARAAQRTDSKGRCARPRSCEMRTPTGRGHYPITRARPWRVGDGRQTCQPRLPACRHLFFPNIKTGTHHEQGNRPRHRSGTQWRPTADRKSSGACTGFRSRRSQWQRSRGVARSHEHECAEERMTQDQYAELLTTVTHMRDAAAALSLSMALFAASEKDASRHSTFMRLHMACNDCALGLKHALDTAPTKVQK